MFVVPDEVWSGVELETVWLPSVELVVLVEVELVDVVSLDVVSVDCVVPELAGSDEVEKNS